jgi:O-antigen/teichoic acid export membrane protein
MLQSPASRPALDRVPPVSEARAVFGHSVIYAFTAILNRAAGLLLLPLYTHFLDPSDYGLLGVITITSEVVGALIGIRLGTAMSRLFFDYAEEREREELVSTAILGMGAIVAAFSIVLALLERPVAAVVLGNADDGVLLFLGVVGLLLNVVFTLGQQHLIVLQRSTAMLVVSTLRSVFFLGFAFLFVAALRMGVFGALLAILLANGLAAAWLIVPLLLRIGCRFSPAKFMAMLRFGAPLLPGQLAELLARFTDRYLLSHLVSMASAGVFFLGLRLSATLQMALISPFNQTYIVRRFEAHGRNEGDAEASRVFTGFFAILVSVALGLSLAAPQLIEAVAFGRPDYYAAALVIPLLALAEVVRSVLLIVELGIFYAKVPRFLTAATLAALGLHVPLTAALIALFGVRGAAGAAVLSTAFRLAVTCRLAKGLNGPRPQWRHLVAILCSAIAVFGLATAVDAAVGETWGLVARLLAAVAYPVLLLHSPVFDDTEREALRRAVVSRLAPLKDVPPNS